MEIQKLHNPKGHYTLQVQTKIASDVLIFICGAFDKAFWNISLQQGLSVVYNL